VSQRAFSVVYQAYPPMAPLIASSTGFVMAHTGSADVLCLRQLKDKQPACHRRRNGSEQDNHNRISKVVVVFHVSVSRRKAASLGNASTRGKTAF
jgi:hypothetical protein